MQLKRALFVAADVAATTTTAPRVGVTPVFQQAGWPGTRGARVQAVDSASLVEAIVNATLHSTRKGHTHWSTRTIAAQVGVTAATVHEIWKVGGLMPPVVETFELSRHPCFEEKLTAVVGLHLCMEEKSQVQALDAPQPSLPRTNRRRTGNTTRDIAETIVRRVELLPGLRGDRL